MAVFEIYFEDLTPEAQGRLLGAVEISKPSEALWDTLPVARISVQVVTT